MILIPPPIFGQGLYVQVDVWVEVASEAALMQYQVSPLVSSVSVHSLCEWSDGFRWHVPSLDTGHFSAPTLQIFT